MSDFFDSLPTDEEAELPVPPGSYPTDHDSRLQERFKAELLKFDGVEGWALKGPDRLVVYVRDQESAERLPKEVAGRTTERVVSGQIRPL